VIKIVEPDTTALIGEIINYTIIVENLGPSLARAVNFTDEIRSSGTFTVVSINAPGYTVNRARLCALCFFQTLHKTAMRTSLHKRVGHSRLDLY
jgi:uncharacterized repeat protein (TIGR01451 family)